jgi:hypothetical protein
LTLVSSNDEHAHASSELKLSDVTGAKANNLPGAKDGNDLKSIVHMLKVHCAKRKCGNNAREVQVRNATIKDASRLPENDMKEEIQEHERKGQKNLSAANMFRIEDTKYSGTEKLNAKHSSRKNACAITDKPTLTAHTRDKNDGKFSDAKVRQNGEPKHNEQSEDLIQAAEITSRKESSVRQNRKENRQNVNRIPAADEDHKCR